MEHVDVRIQRRASGSIQMLRAGGEPLTIGSDILARSTVLSSMLNPLDGGEHTSIALPEGYLCHWFQYVTQASVAGAIRRPLDDLIVTLKVWNLKRPRFI